LRHVFSNLQLHGHRPLGGAMESALGFAGL
jgi:hypothetical protein